MRFTGLRPVAVLAAVVLASAGCGLSLQAMPKPGGQTGPSYRLHAVFSNVLNVPDNAQVRDGSALVGQVSSITTHGYKADLVIDIHRDVRLPVGTTAQVRFDSPLGDDYIVLSTPAGSDNGPFLANGASLPESDTSTAPSVEDTLAALGAVLNGGGIDQLEVVISELNKAFTGNQPEIKSFLERLATNLASLSAHSQDLDNALVAIGSLAGQLNAGAGTITTGIDAIAPAVTVLANENNDFQQLLVNTTQLTTVAKSILSQSGQGMINDTKELLPVLNQLVGVEQTLGPDLADIAKFEATTPKIAPGNYLQVSLNTNININSSPNTPTPGLASPRVNSVTQLLSAGLP